MFSLKTPHGLHGTVGPLGWLPGLCLQTRRRLQTRHKTFIRSVPNCHSACALREWLIYVLSHLCPSLVSLSTSEEAPLGARAVMSSSAHAGADIPRPIWAVK